MEAKQAPSFEYSPLKENIDKIAASMKERISVGEAAAKEAIHETISPPIVAATQAADEPLTDAETKILPDYMKNEPVEIRIRVEKLIDVAWHKNIKTAVKLAKKSGEPLLIDALHDALTDKLYEELKRRGDI